MVDYTHRRKADGMWDSICMTCYHTATSHTEPELRETEAMHKCLASTPIHPVVRVAYSLR